MHSADLAENSAVETRWLTQSALLLLLVAMWLATRPYTGVVHDARLYAMLASAAATPERYAGDLFTAFGSQDRFTIFSSLLRWPLTWLGVGPGVALATLLTQLLWLGGLVYLARALFDDRRLVAAGVAAVVLVPGGSVFVYGEAFITARLAAEALCLFGLGAMLRSRPWATAAALLSGLLIHAITAIGAVGIGFVLLAMPRPRLWLLPVAATGIAMAFAVSGVEPWTRLLSRFDTEWFAIVHRRDFYVFPSQWTDAHWVLAFSSLTLALLGAVATAGALRCLCKAASGIALGGLAVALIGGDLLHNVLIVDAQLWRAVWLAGIAGHLALAPLAARAIGSNRPLAFAVSTVIAALAFGHFSFAFAAVAAPALPVVAALACLLQGGPPLSRVGRLAAIAALISLAASAGLAAYWTLLRPISTLGSPRHQLMSVVLIIAALLLGAAIILDRLPPRLTPRIAVAAAAVLAAVAAWGWDQQTPWRRFVDAGIVPSTLTRLLPPAGPIYWEGDVRVPWLLLHRGSYYSCPQGAGVLFSRPTAIAYRQRQLRFGALQTLDTAPSSLCDVPVQDRAPAPTAAAVTSVCRNAPDLAALVLIHDVANIRRAVWTSPLPYVDPGLNTADIRRFFIFDCAAIRRQYRQ